MRPKNKFQKEIIKISKRLPKISEKQENWAIEACFDKEYSYFYSKAVCQECGHLWRQKPRITIEQYCPNCWKRLHYAKFNTTYAYTCILIKRGNFQIMRILICYKYINNRGPARYMCDEIMQLYIRNDGKHDALMKQGHYFGDNWNHWSDLEPRSISQRRNNLISMIPYKYYPVKSIIPEIKRNGFTGDFYDYSPLKFFTLLLTDPKFEILLKKKEYVLLEAYYSLESSFNRYWSSIRICIRHKFKFEKGLVSLYFDYLDDLEYFKLDLKQTKYLLDPNWRKAHTYYSGIIREQLLEKQKIEEIERKKKQEIAFAEKKGKFFNLEMIEDDIRISTLKSVLEFIEEGKELNHCVASPKYINKEESLIMSAKKGGKRLETIEVSLEDFTIRQARGYDNEPTKDHNKIIRIVNNNMKLIKEAANGR